MKGRKASVKLLTDHFEEARKSFVVRMKSEDEEMINLKIKIATYVIYELSHSTPSWFKSYFLSNISKNSDKMNIFKSKKILKVENEFFNAIGDYLINMESEIEYVKKILAPLTQEWDKKDFWKPIVTDAFFLVDIYFASSLELSKNNINRTGAEQLEKNTNTPGLFPMLSENSALL
ncbi:MAG: hypothetical protein HGB33_09795 [Syntrophaceae bacterium]|nr:hypothetical protein [Syntrophaceae bacterium]